MPKMRKKKVIGLLGGIGSGKSTAATCFARLGCAVIEADATAHRILEEEDVKDAIRAIFGAGVLDASGRVNRAVLGRIVFADVAALEKLNGLIHPPVMAEVERQIEAYQAAGTVRAIVLDVPLLAEVGRTDLCDVLVFVQADQNVRRQRVRNSGKFDENEMDKRENFQISLDTKRQMADYIVFNNSDESELAEQVAQLLSTVTG